MWVRVSITVAYGVTHREGNLHLWVAFFNPLAICDLSIYHLILAVSDRQHSNSSPSSHTLCLTLVPSSSGTLIVCVVISVPEQSDSESVELILQRSR